MNIAKGKRRPFWKLDAEGGIVGIHSKIHKMRVKSYFDKTSINSEELRKLQNE